MPCPVNQEAAAKCCIVVMQDPAMFGRIRFTLFRSLFYVVTLINCLSRRHLLSLNNPIRKKKEYSIHFTFDFDCELALVLVNLVSVIPNIDKTNSIQ